jgi:hypothetical protein
MYELNSIVRIEGFNALRVIDEREFLDVIEEHISKTPNIIPVPSRYKCGIDDDKYIQTANVELECLNKLLEFGDMKIDILSEKLDPDKEEDDPYHFRFVLVNPKTKKELGDSRCTINFMDAVKVLNSREADPGTDLLIKKGSVIPVIYISFTESYVAGFKLAEILLRYILCLCAKIPIHVMACEIMTDYSGLITDWNNNTLCFHDILAINMSKGISLDDESFKSSSQSNSSESGISQSNSSQSNSSQSNSSQSKSSESKSSESNGSESGSCDDVCESGSSQFSNSDSELEYEPLNRHQIKYLMETAVFEEELKPELIEALLDYKNHGSQEFVPPKLNSFQLKAREKLNAFADSRYFNKRYSKVKDLQKRSEIIEASRSAFKSKIEEFVIFSIPVIEINEKTREINDFSITDSDAKLFINQLFNKDFQPYRGRSIYFIQNLEEIAMRIQRIFGIRTKIGTFVGDISRIIRRFNLSLQAPRAAASASAASAMDNSSESTEDEDEDEELLASAATEGIAYPREANMSTSILASAAAIIDPNAASAAIEDLRGSTTQIQERGAIEDLRGATNQIQEREERAEARSARAAAIVDPNAPIKKSRTNGKGKLGGARKTKHKQKGNKNKRKTKKGNKNKRKTKKGNKKANKKTRK